MSYGFKVKFENGEAVTFDSYGDLPENGDQVWVTGHSYKLTSGKEAVSIGAIVTDENEITLLTVSGIGTR